jgi:hypothetical protein
VIHAKFLPEFGGYTGETSVGMGKVSKTEEEDKNNAPVADVEAATATHSGGGRSNNWGEKDTSRLDSSDYEQGYLGVVHYVNNTAIVGTASSDTLSEFLTDGSAVPNNTDTPSLISIVGHSGTFKAGNGRVDRRHILKDTSD